VIRPKGLGRGLDALLAGADEASDRESLQTLAIDRVKPGRYQPRTRMDEASLDDLAASIREHGVMQPILVRPVEGGRFELIAGERRWRAAQRAGLAEIPALVKSVPDQAALALALIENIQREDLNPLEQANGIHRLIDEFGLTHEAAAKAVGRSRSAVTNLLRLRELETSAEYLMDPPRHGTRTRAAPARAGQQTAAAAHRGAGLPCARNRTASRTTSRTQASATPSAARARRPRPRSAPDELARRLGAR
jgi:ParB family chromosome partitioning protein